MAFQFADPRDDSSQPFDQITICSSSKTVLEPPPFCEHENRFHETTVAIESDIGSYVRTTTSRNINLLRGIIRCNQASPPSVSGTFQATTFSQCCKNTDTIESAIEESGSVTVTLSGLSCEMKLFRLHGVTFSGVVTTSANASAQISSQTGICGSQSRNRTISGSINGSLGAAIRVVLITEGFVSASLSGSGAINAFFSGYRLSNLSTGSGSCFGPLTVGGKIRFIGGIAYSVTYAVPNTTKCL